MRPALWGLLGWAIGTAVAVLAVILIPGDNFAVGLVLGAVFAIGGWGFGLSYGLKRE